MSPRVHERAARATKAVALIAALLGLGTTAAFAQGPTDAGAPISAAPSSVRGCVESIPKGATRPVVNETFPERGTSGWATTLSITVVHGKGERVLPSGLDLSSASDAKKYLKEAEFSLPDQDGGAGARLFDEPDDPSKPLTTTHLELPLVPLPKEPGRALLRLPPLPVAIARANGEIATVCTRPHTIVVDDPTANVPDAKPKDNPPPRPQREEWTALKKAVSWGALGIVLGALLAYLAYRLLSRPKPVAPPPPPRPPWEVALEQLASVRHEGLLEAGRHMEYFDRVNDAVRGYFGARFGFDGLESTTDEILAALRKQAGGFVHAEGATDLQQGVGFDEVRAFLAECDLVKFANLLPTPEQCAAAIETGEWLVRKTSPLAGPSARVTIAAPETATSSAASENKASAVAPVDADAQWKPPAATDAPRSALAVDAVDEDAASRGGVDEGPPRGGDGS